MQKKKKSATQGNNNFFFVSSVLVVLKARLSSFFLSPVQCRSDHLNTFPRPHKPAGQIVHYRNKGKMFTCTVRLGCPQCPFCLLRGWFCTLPVLSCHITPAPAALETDSVISARTVRLHLSICSVASHHHVEYDQYIPYGFVSVSTCSIASYHIQRNHHTQYGSIL